jgi:hypothetical protein
MADRHARGWIAVGHYATGGIAVGTVLARGYVAIGLNALGVVAVGVNSVGVFALGVAGALGAIAMGTIALGGFAQGLYSAGIASQGIFTRGWLASRRVGAGVEFERYLGGTPAPSGSKAFFDAASPWIGGTTWHSICTAPLPWLVIVPALLGLVVALSVWWLARQTQG